MTARFLAVVNRAAGGGRCGKQADTTIAHLQEAGVAFDVVESQHPGHGIEVARRAYRDGRRHFIAVGGDGTAYEVVNGVFPESQQQGAVTLAFLPLGTGNSFLRDFSSDGAQHAGRALLEGRQRPCDVLRMQHRDGTVYFINLLSMGFAADVASLTNKRFKRFGPLGYLLGVLACLAKLDRRSFPLRIDTDADLDRRRALFLSFNNSKFTGGKMMIAPNAATDDGLIEYVRWGPIDRWGLIRNLHTLYDGTHLNHPLASRRAARRVDFDLSGPEDVMIDGEVLHIQCTRLEVLPGALNVVV